MCTIQGWTDIQSQKERKGERERLSEKVKSMERRSEERKRETRQERAFTPVRTGSVEAGSGMEAAQVLT